MFRKFLTNIIVRRLFGKPELASLIDARLGSFRALFRAGMNMAGWFLGFDRVFGLNSITVEVTNFCNLKCVMCPSNRTSRRPKGHMPFDLFKKIIDDAQGVEYVQLYTWGEPLLNPDFFRMIDYVASKGMRVHSITNGTLLNDENIERLLKTRLTGIGISVDGTGEYYEKIRGFSYERIERNIEALLERRNALKSSLKIELLMCVQKENEENVDAFRERWEGKVDRVQLQPQEFVVDVPADYKRTRPCWEPWTGNLFVHWNGVVAPCCIDYDDVLIVGDASKDSLRSILNGTKMRALRRSIKKGNFDALPLCSHCVEYKTTWVNNRFE
jgi:MoaA/NifB/PqqE/SkfB family radical SAM enzyme